jgi:hypothetical protein
MSPFPDGTGMAGDPFTGQVYSAEKGNQSTAPVAGGPRPVSGPGAWPPGLEPQGGTSVSSGAGLPAYLTNPSAFVPSPEERDPAEGLGQLADPRTASTQYKPPELQADASQQAAPGGTLNLAVDTDDVGQLPGEVAHEGHSATLFNTGIPLNLSARTDDGLVWKVAVKTGTLALSPGPGQMDLDQPLELTPDLFMDVKAAFDEKAFPYVTVPETHANGALENTGYVKKLEILDKDQLLADARISDEGKAHVADDPDDTRYLLSGIGFTNPKAREAADNGSLADTSVGIKFGYRNKRTGKTYQAALEHLALTNVPWVDGNIPFNAGATLGQQPFDQEEAEYTYDGVYCETDGSLELAVTTFDPQAHPRDYKGKFREILGGLKAGDSAKLPDGVTVTAIQPKDKKRLDFQMKDQDGKTMITDADHTVIATYALRKSNTAGGKDQPPPDNLGGGQDNERSDAERNLREGRAPDETEKDTREVIEPPDTTKKPRSEAQQRSVPNAGRAGDKHTPSQIRQMSDTQLKSLHGQFVRGDADRRMGTAAAKELTRRGWFLDRGRWRKSRNLSQDDADADADADAEQNMLNLGMSIRMTGSDYDSIDVDMSQAGRLLAALTPGDRLELPLGVCIRSLADEDEAATVYLVEQGYGLDSGARLHASAESAATAAADAMLERYRKEQAERAKYADRAVPMYASQDGSAGTDTLLSEDDEHGSLDLSNQETFQMPNPPTTVEEALAQQRADIERLNAALESERTKNLTLSQSVVEQGQTLHTKHVAERVQQLQAEGVSPAFLLAAKTVWEQDGPGHQRADDGGLNLSVQASVPKADGTGVETVERKLNTPSEIVEFLLSAAQRRRLAQVRAEDTDQGITGAF